jgi:hypothetical protein
LFPPKIFVPVGILICREEEEEDCDGCYWRMTGKMAAAPAKRRRVQ